MKDLSGALSKQGAEDGAAVERVVLNREVEAMTKPKDIPRGSPFATEASHTLHKMIQCSVFGWPDGSELSKAHQLLYRIEKERGELLAAAEIVLAGLNARIDAAPDNAKPVFNGIAELRAAIGKCGGQQ